MHGLMEEQQADLEKDNKINGNFYFWGVQGQCGSGRTIIRGDIRIPWIRWHAEDDLQLGTQIFPWIFESAALKYTISINVSRGAREIGTKTRGWGAVSQKNFHGAYVNGIGQIDLWTDIEPRDMIEVAYCRFIYIYRSWLQLHRFWSTWWSSRSPVGAGVDFELTTNCLAVFGGNAVTIHLSGGIGIFFHAQVSALPIGTWDRLWIPIHDSPGGGKEENTKKASARMDLSASRSNKSFEKAHWNWLMRAITNDDSIHQPGDAQ